MYEVIDEPPSELGADQLTLAEKLLSADAETLNGCVGGVCPPAPGLLPPPNAANLGMISPYPNLETLPSTV